MILRNRRLLLISYFVQFLNLSGLDRKLQTEEQQNQVKFVWEECLPLDFTNFTLQEDNYKALSILNLNYQKCSDIVSNYLKEDSGRLQVLTQYVQSNLTILKFAFATLFPKFFSRIVLSGIEEKTIFDFSYHQWWNKKYNQ